jgi:lipopolysaccharide export system permease protein
VPLFPLRLVGKEARVFWHILQRVIFFELLKIFALALLGITGIIVMAGIVAEATQRGLTPAQIIMVIPLLVPSFLPYTVPATTLFAACIVYGRLAHDNEVLALKSAGVHVLYVIWPGLFVGVLMSAVTMSLYYHTIPYSHRLLRTQVLKDVEEYLYAMLKKDHCIKQPGLNYSMWVHQVQGKRLLDAIFRHQNEQGQYDIIARAEEAELHVDLENKQVIVQMRHGNAFGADTAKGYATFDFQEWRVELPSFMDKNVIRPTDLVWQELLVKRQDLIADRAKAAAKLDAERQRGTASRPALDDLAYAAKRVQLELNSVNAELHMRPALSFGCLFFVLVGCAVGIWFGRSDYLSAFITCFLPIVVIYYPLLLCFTNLAKDGRLPAGIALWAANGVLALAAPVLFWRLARN